MMRKFALPFGVALTALAMPSPALSQTAQSGDGGYAMHSAADPVALAKVADRVFGELAQDGSPGCSLGLVDHGRFVLKRSYGHANLDWGTPIMSNTVFYSGSVSKQFTAASIVLLAQDGALSLDDPIQKLFPEFSSWSSELTIRHIVHHISGIPDMYRVMDKHGMTTWDRLGTEEALELLASEPLDFEPGERYSYSNGGYFVLSQVVLRASGKSLREFSSERIFQPLGMLDTHFHDQPTHIVPRRAMSYAPAQSGSAVDGDSGDAFVQSYQGNFALPGAGGLYTTVDDFIEWDENFRTGQVGGAGFSAALETQGVLNSGEQLDYAFGVRHDTFEGDTFEDTPVVEHTGSYMGFKAYYVRFPELDRSMWTFCNYGPLVPKEMTLEVAKAWLEGP